MGISLVFTAAVGLFTGLAAVTDLRSRRVPNVLTVPTALAGLAYHVIAPDGWGLVTSLGGFALGFVLLLVPALSGGGGMGDVKLLAALGAWLGPLYILMAFAASAVAAAVLAIGVLTYAAATQGMLKAQHKYLRKKQARGKNQVIRPARVLPFAVPVALSTWMVLAWLAVGK